MGPWAAVPPGVSRSSWGQPSQGMRGPGTSGCHLQHSAGDAGPSFLEEQAVGGLLWPMLESFLTVHLSLRRAEASCSPPAGARSPSHNNEKRLLWSSISRQWC